MTPNKSPLRKSLQGTWVTSEPSKHLIQTLSTLNLINERLDLARLAEIEHITIAVDGVLHRAIQDALKKRRP